MNANKEAMEAGAIEPNAAQLVQAILFLEEMRRPVTERKIENEEWKAGQVTTLQTLINTHADLANDGMSNRLNDLARRQMAESDARLSFRLIDNFSQQSDWRSRQGEEGHANDLLQLQDMIDDLKQTL